MHKLKIGLEEIAQISSSINNFYQLSNYFMQLDTKQLDSLTTFFKSKFPLGRLNNSEYDTWCDVNLYYFSQTWSNTSAGFEGIGGAAMTSSYTLIIENLNYDFSAIFYNNTLAYICEIDDDYIKYKNKGFYNMPGIHSCRKELKIVYTKR